MYGVPTVLAPGRPPVFDSQSDFVSQESSCFQLHLPDCIHREWRQNRQSNYLPTLQLIVKDALLLNFLNIGHVSLQLCSRERFLGKFQQHCIYLKSLCSVLIARLSIFITSGLQSLLMNSSTVIP